MTTQKIHFFILSGGAGTRLWPVSREALPKQFHDLTGAGSPLLVQTLARVSDLGPVSIVTNQDLNASTAGLLNRYAYNRVQVVAEPCRRNTAAAVYLSAWKALRSEGPQALVAVLPADHIISDTRTFQALMEDARILANEGQVVTLGIKPTYPATAYGYIQYGDVIAASPGKRAKLVKCFLEKPNEEKAAALIASGNVGWNAGIFIFKAQVMLDLFKKHMPAIPEAFAKLDESCSNLSEVYAKIPSISVDYAIMEKLSDIVCLPADMGWTDVGSWEEISVLSKNAPKHPTQQVGGAGNFYSSIAGQMAKQVAFVGLSDVIAVDTPDALLVMKKGSGQNVRDVVENLRGHGDGFIKTHTFEDRPWGRFEILMDTDYFKSKRITVLPGQKLSYQSHKKRAEHWIVVKGLAEVTLNDEVHQLKAGDHIFIPLGAKHRMANPGTEPMEFVEVQTGTYFGEDDIIRYQDNYGRS